MSKSAETMFDIPRRLLEALERWGLLPQPVPCLVRVRRRSWPVGRDARS